MKPELEQREWITPPEYQPEPKQPVKAEETFVENAIEDILK